MTGIKTKGEDESVAWETFETKRMSIPATKPRRHDNDWITQEISAWLEQKTFENLCWYYQRELRLSNRGAMLNESGLSMAEVQRLKRWGILKTSYSSGVKGAVLTDKAKKILKVHRTRLIRHELSKGRK